MLETPTLGDLFKQHKKKHTGSDIFAVVMLIIASIGAAVAVYANDYVSKKLLVLKDPALTGVLELNQTPPGFATNPDPNFEVDVHYVCTNSSNINVQLSEATYYNVNTYVSFYLPYLLCGQNNTSAPQASVIIYLNSPSESLTATYTLNRNNGALFMVCYDLGVLKWKLMRTWSLDLLSTGYIGMTGLTDANSFILDGRAGTTTVDPVYGAVYKGPNQPKTLP